MFALYVPLLRLPTQDRTESKGRIRRSAIGDNANIAQSDDHRFLCSGSAIFCLASLMLAVPRPTTNQSNAEA